MGNFSANAGKVLGKPGLFVTLNLGYAGFEASADSGPEVVGYGGVVCRKDIRVRGVGELLM